MTESPNDDVELLRRLSKGDEAAFESLYGRYQGPIYRFALHMSGDAAGAEEITQEVFMAVITKPKAYDPAKGTVAGYMFGIARNLMRRSMQRTSQDVPFLEDCEAADGRETADLGFAEEFSHAESLECLRKAIASLPDAYREVVVLCELQEMAYPEAASILSCSAGTVASRLHRAKAMLKTKLKGLGYVKRCVG